MADLLIIGAGAAGIIAAISSKRAHPEHEITILEKNPTLGKKILICGAGRCNVTNASVSMDRYYGAPSKFIATVLNQFNNKDIINFLKELGIALYEEEKNGRKKGKIFPITNQAKTITELLESELSRLGIHIEYNAEVNDIIVNDGFKVNYAQVGNVKTLECEYLILACGGLTYPTLGATGFGIDIAKRFGHHIIEPVPSALPLEVNHPLIQRAAGIRIDVQVTSVINGKTSKSDTDEMLFTRYGLSGPVILNISREISVRINREKQNDCFVKINFFPDMNKDSLKNLLELRWTAKQDQLVLHSLYGLLPNDLVKLILDELKINPTNTNSSLSKQDKIKLSEFLTDWTLKITATKGWNEGEFTAGGIDTKEVKPSLESKLISKLYFAGELLNVDGDVGGFNLSWAWSSGYVAGKLT